MEFRSQYQRSVRLGYQYETSLSILIAKESKSTKWVRMEQAIYTNDMSHMTHMIRYWPTLNHVSAQTNEIIICTVYSVQLAVLVC